MEGGMKRLASWFSLGASLQAVTGLRCIAASVFYGALSDGRIAPGSRRPARDLGPPLNLRPALFPGSTVMRRTA